MQIFSLLNTNFKCCCKQRNGFNSCTAKHGLLSENEHVYNLHSYILCVPERIYTARGWEKRHLKVKEKKKRERRREIWDIHRKN